MKNYIVSFKMLGLAILAVIIGTVWDNAALIASAAFLAFILLAIKKAFEASKTFRSKIKLLTVLSALLVGLVILGFTVMNPPQCPDSYTSAQIDAAHGSCIVGANIGLGIYLIFLILPLTLLLLALWIGILLSARKHSPKN